MKFMTRKLRIFVFLFFLVFSADSHAAPGSKNCSKWLSPLKPAFALWDHYSLSRNVNIILTSKTGAEIINPEPQIAFESILKIHSKDRLANAEIEAALMAVSGHISQASENKLVDWFLDNADPSSSQQLLLYLESHNEKMADYIQRYTGSYSSSDTSLREMKQTHRVLNTVLFELAVKTGFTPEVAQYFGRLAIDSKIALAGSWSEQKPSPGKSEESTRLREKIFYPLVYQKMKPLIIEILEKITGDRNNGLGQLEYRLTSFGINFEALANQLGYDHRDTVRRLMSAQNGDRTNFEKNYLFNVLHFLTKHFLENALVYTGPDGERNAPLFVNFCSIAILIILEWMSGKPSAFWQAPQFKEDYIIYTSGIAPNVKEHFNRFSAAAWEMLNISTIGGLDRFLGSPHNFSSELVFQFSSLVAQKERGN